MRKFYLPVALATLCIVPGVASNSIDANRPGFRSESFRFMPEAKAPHMLGVNDRAIVSADPQAKAKAIAATPDALPEGDITGFIDTPDGEPWYYVGHFTKNEERHISHFKFVVYDSAFKEVTTIEDDTELAENETRIVDVQLSAQVTRKFFNSDDMPEFAVAFAANTPEYVNHYYTKVYTQGTAEPIGSFEGYWATQVNTSTDNWSENFYIGFLTEQETQTPEIGGVVNTMDYVIDIYKKAGYSTPSEKVLEIRIPGVAAGGESWVPVLAVAHEGNAYFAANYLKYSYFEEPMNPMNENLTPDNELLIDYYEVPRYGEPEKIHHNSIPVETSVSDMNFYYLGAFMFDGDVTYGRYTEDADVPAFTITRAHYEKATDGYSYSYYVYPAGTEETPQTEKILTLGENIDGVTLMSDIPGYDPQALFVKKSGEEEFTFEFVNLINGTVECTLPYFIDDYITMNAGVDRVASAEGPLYVVSQYMASSDDEGNAIHLVPYIKPDGTIHHIDRLNLGKNVAYAETFNTAYALDPYVFNTDPGREYMVLVKRFEDADNTTNHEEFMVVSPTNGNLLTLLPDEELGNISYIWLEDQSEYGQNLCLTYMTEDYRYNMRRYELPFVKFAGGDGTAENPYQISTLGDLRQVKYDLDANYVMVNDIDARDAQMEHVTGSFSGTFDGAGHNIISPELGSMGLFENIVKGENQTDAPVVKNINIIEPEMTVADYTEAGVLASMANGAEISGIRIYDAEIDGETENVNVTFGGLVGSSSLYSKIADCAVVDAKINLPESTVGGIAGKIMTASSVKACSFSGEITGGISVGGIVGETNSAEDVIEDCHVNAKIVAFNTVGGVAGVSERGIMRRCHVQGSIEATTAPIWGGGPAAGGLIGQLKTGWEETTGEVVKLINGNFINLSSLKAFTPEGEPEFEGQYDSMHRVIGASCVNEGGEPIYDENWNLVGYEDVEPETIIGDNYVIDTLPRANEAIADDAATTEGKSVAAADLNKEFFEGLGYVYGTETAAPWSEISPNSPTLWFETGTLLFDKDAYKVELEGNVDLVIDFYGVDVDENIAGAMTVEIADESVLEFANMSLVDGKVVVTVKGLVLGNTVVTASYNGQTTTTSVTVEAPAGIETVNEDLAPALEINGTVAVAEGCAIEVYNMTGARVAAGNGICDLSDLAGGVYVVSAADKAGHRSSVKVML